MHRQFSHCVQILRWLGGTVISATVIDKHRQCVSHTVGHTARERWDKERDREKETCKRKRERKRDRLLPSIYSLACCVSLIFRVARAGDHSDHGVIVLSNRCW